MAVPPFRPYNGVGPQDWTALRAEVLAVSAKPKPDDPVRVELIAGQPSRRFVYAPCASQFCARHDLVLNGPWVDFVKRALGLPPAEPLAWDHCMGIYVLISQPGADALAWHTDFCPLENTNVGKHQPSRQPGPGLKREEYLHKVVNVLVPLQELDEGMGFTVILDRERGRHPLRVTRQGQWYSLVGGLGGVGGWGGWRMCGI